MEENKVDRKNVYITGKIPSVGKMLLEENFYVEENRENRSLTKNELIDKVKDKNALITHSSDIIDKEVIDASDNLQVIANYGDENNNIDIDAANKREIVVSNVSETKDIMAETIANNVINVLNGNSPR